MKRLVVTILISSAMTVTLAGAEPSAEPPVDACGTVGLVAGAIGELSPGLGAAAVAHGCTKVPDPTGLVAGAVGQL
jgi:hypothetical protein